MRKSHLVKYPPAQQVLNGLNEPDALSAFTPPGPLNITGKPILIQIRLNPYANGSTFQENLPSGFSVALIYEGIGLIIREYRGTVCES